MTSSVLLSCLVAAAITSIEPGSSPIRINEMAAGSSGFVEIRNTGNGTADLGGWVIRTCKGGKTAALATVPLGTELPAGAFFLVVGRDFTGTAQRQLIVETVETVEGGVSLRNSNGARIDSLGFTSNSPCREGTPSEQCVNASVGRDVRSWDTDDNAADFTCQMTTPDQVND